MSEHVGDTPPGHRRRRLLAWVAAGLALVVLAGAGAVVGLYRHLEGQLGKVHGVLSSPGPSGPTTRADGSTAPAPAPAATYLIVGTDSRAGANGQLPHTGGTPCHCADSIIVAHVPKGHAKATLLSIPRDSWVEVPEWTSPAGRRFPAHHAKINSTLTEGGAGLLVTTVEALTGLRVDHYVEVSFAGFVGVVNAVHGVDVCLTEPSRDWHTGVDLTAGEHHLDGVQALGYVRQRYGLPGSDLDRIRRQQAVLGEIVGKVLHAGILLHPARLTGFLNQVTKSLTVDDTLSFGDIRKLASTFSHLDTGKVAFATTPVADAGAVRGGASVVLLDHRKLDRMLNRIARGESPRPRGTGHPGSPGPTPSQTGDGVPCLR